MSEHPGIVFRPGPTRRRAALASGPDVREVARAVKSARSTKHKQADDRLPGPIADNTGTPLRLIRTSRRSSTQHSVSASRSDRSPYLHQPEQARLLGLGRSPARVECARGAAAYVRTWLYRPAG
jgi:hypothetical protein